jgi:hypothetical protein
MKKLLNIKTAVFSLFTMLLVYSCETDMNYLHEKYIKDGEITYAENPTYISYVPGNNRIQLFMGYAMPKNLVKCYIYWSKADGSIDSVGVALPTGQSASVIVDTILTNLTEKTYTFTFKTLDKFGNWSVPKQKTFPVYGEFYRKSLTPRIISDVKAFHQTGTDSIYIYWLQAPKTPNDSAFVADSTVITYKNKTTGTDMNVVVKNSISITKLGDYNWAVDTLKITTFYNKLTALDLFVTDVAKVKPAEFLLNKKSIVAKVLTNDQANSGATTYSYLWNDSIISRCGKEKVTTFFKKTDNKVYTFTFDLGAVTKLTKMTFYPHSQNYTSMLKKFEVYGSTTANPTTVAATAADPLFPLDMTAKGWILLQRVDLSTSVASSAPVVVGIDPTINIRYIRIRSLDTFNTDGKTTVISEIEAYTNVVP